jgi:hypothetical protein
MIRAIALGVIFAPLAIGAAQAKPEVIDGQWLFRYPCDRLTGMYADRCKAGEGDFFQLFLRKSGNEVCGSYALTTQGQNHVDEGEVKDWTFVETKSTAAYHVRFLFDGDSGEATIRVDDAGLHWDVIKETKIVQTNSMIVSPSPPKHAILTKQSSKKWPPCDTAKQQQQI